MSCSSTISYYILLNNFKTQVMFTSGHTYLDYLFSITVFIPSGIIAIIPNSMTDAIQSKQEQVSSKCVLLGLHKQASVIK